MSVSNELIMNKKYQYNEIDCLEFPQKYQMSVFEGNNFLIKYKESRNEIIKKIKNKKIDLVIYFEEDYEINNNEYLKINKNECFETEKIFKFFLNRIFKNKLNLKHKKLINKFISKFEISKKIFMNYDYNIKTDSNNYKIMKNYLMLSLICMKIYEEENNLKYLNATLKINDITTSNFNKILDKIDLILLKQSLELELKQIEILMNKKGLRII